MTRDSNERPNVIVNEVIDNAPTGIYIKDPDGKYLYVNKHYEDAVGIPRDEILGRTDFDLYPSEAATAYRRDDLLALAAMAPVFFNERGAIDGSERVFASVKFPVLQESDVLGVCGISVDITDSIDEELGPDMDRRVVSTEAYFGRLLASLTPQEVRVLDLVATGLSDREIAEKLHLSSDTVRHHVSHLLKKLRKRRAQVIIEMLKRGRA